MDFSRPAGDQNGDGIEAALLDLKTELLVDFANSVLLEAITHAGASAPTRHIATLITGYLWADIVEACPSLRWRRDGSRDSLAKNSRQTSRPERQPTEGDGIDARLAPGGDHGGETGLRDFRGGEVHAAGVALINVESGQPEMDHRRRVEGGAEVHLETEGAKFIAIFRRGCRQIPIFGEVADVYGCGQ